MSVSSLQDLFVHTLKDIYFAENHISKKLPTMAEKANSKQLKDLFQAHLGETKEQISRLEKVFQSIGEKASGEECPAIEGITKEAEELMGEVEDAKTMDAALISSAQAVEHYEITRYGTLVSWATELGYDEAANLLRQSLAEEKDADNKLLRLGEDSLNAKAA